MDVHPIDASSGTAPYEQLRTQIAARVASGELAAGTRLPTVRALAGELRLAVNTVARVYRELETDGIVVTEGRRGTFVAGSAVAGTAEVRDAAVRYAVTLRRAGVSVAEAHKLLDESWSGAPAGRDA